METDLTAAPTLDEDAPAQLPWSVLLLYASPALGLGFMFFFLSTYLLKFATDVLLISPFAMGVILLVSRIWDGVSDPLAGFLSDRTDTSLGRRRPWLLAGAVPMGVIFALMWSPPGVLGETGLVLWMGALVILFYTTLTVLMMPHDALGAELCEGYQERNRIFGWKRFLFGLGALALFVLMGDVAEGAAEERSRIAGLALITAAITTGLFLLCGVRIRERRDYRGRGPSRPFSAMADVWRNPHARQLIFVFFVQQMAVGVLLASVAYFAHYVLGDPSALGALLGVFFVSSVVAIPVWMALGRRYEKKTLAVASMCAVSFVLTTFLWVGKGDWTHMVVIAALGGAAGACLDIVFPSIQADVIDFDEYLTGERKEGVYFSVWALASKTANGLAGVLVGLALWASGFVPNAEQSSTAELTIRLLVSGIPAALYTAGLLLFVSFPLNRRAHERIRTALDERAATRHAP